MNPEQLRFSKEHEWVSAQEDSRVAVIGITDYAAEELGDIVFVELPQKGTELTFMEPMGTIEAVKTVADIYAPVSGTIREVNTALEDNPELVNNEPYDGGWFVKIDIKEAGEIEKLMNYEAYKSMIGRD